MKARDPVPQHDAAESAGTARRVRGLAGGISALLALLLVTAALAAFLIGVTIFLPEIFAL